MKPDLILPAIRQLISKGSLEDIERLMDSVLNREDSFLKKLLQDKKLKIAAGKIVEGLMC